MNYNQGAPLLGATFVPGGFDDYYMPATGPEVVSPAPQRIMPEVPEQMQDNLAHLESEARSNSISNQSSQPNQYNRAPPDYKSQASHSTNYQQEQYGGYNSSNAGHQQQNQRVTSPYEQRSISQPPPQIQSTKTEHYSRFSTSYDAPNFSPFPKIKNRPANVPPTDDEKEAVLEDARMPVLNSNDPEMQLAWAQDALAYVDAAQMHEQRISETQTARPATPQVEHQLRVDAMNIVSFLADQHHPKAEFMRGMWLEFGKFGLRVDKKEAFRCYSRSADKGYARAEYRIGMQYEQSNDPIKALIHYKRGAEAGDSASNYRLGMMTLLGQHGQQQDYAKGIQLIRQAASTADENAPQGAFVLGMLQARELPQVNVPELFLPYDEKMARINIEKAAFLGFAKAQLKMGSAYELCSLGCEFNPALSLHYNALAARQGESEADMAISKWFLCGYEGVFQKNEELAYTYAHRAAQAGLATAEFAMGYFNEIGMYTPVNLDKALEWYEKAAKGGNKDAEGRIEGIAKQRTLTKKDHENVAINRIRSQYGSKRGGRPERFKVAAPALPIINDSPSSEYSNSPGGSALPRVEIRGLTSNTASSPLTARAPSRAATSTPYPIDERPPVIAPLDRPATVAPYPLDNGPPLGSGRGGPPGGGFFAPELRAASVAPRPSSAFGINPNILAPQGGSRRDDRMGLPSQGSTNLPLRPYTSVGDMGGGRGRPPQGGQRVPSGSDYSDRPQSTRPPSGPDRAQSQPVADIGYAAPSEGRNRLQKPGNPNLGKQQPKLPDIGFQAPLEPKKTPQLDHPQPRTSSMDTYDRRNQNPTIRPTSDRPATTRPGSSGGRSSARQEPLPSVPTKIDNGPKPKPQVEASANKPTAATTKPAAVQAKHPTATHPPGKGPKTFDEMGIAQAKQDSDCVSTGFFLIFFSK
ncbi:hypothetical protein M501DRAFT_997473 [Patellaria atrata CBS 101060]|uniref:HCP-like protein n=1 Tax=Patellaria atrata CBS 101060 TaxID=1346257 RepID=A0A9P4S5S9_9PEZI|nr:hypothetical protein M501DRAFT_997473 [Patellaria atrata CBS 101060]